MALSARTVMVARAEPEKSCSVAFRQPPGVAEPWTGQSVADVRAGLLPATHG
ncbi:MAG TPA: hypothetical protein VF657_15600 [Actinoplanes sp.]|jgi:hypothetical protein